MSDYEQIWRGRKNLALQYVALLDTHRAPHPATIPHTKTDFLL